MFFQNFCRRRLTSRHRSSRPENLLPGLDLRCRHISASNPRPRRLTTVGSAARLEVPALLRPDRGRRHRPAFRRSKPGQGPRSRPCLRRLNNCSNHLHINSSNTIFTLHHLNKRSSIINPHRKEEPRIKQDQSDFPTCRCRRQFSRHPSFLRFRSHFRPPFRRTTHLHIRRHRARHLIHLRSCCPCGIRCSTAKGTSRTRWRPSRP